MATKTKKNTKSLNPICVGNAVIIRTVTFYYTGRIVEITPTEIVLEDVAWIADTGRFEAALRTGQFNEVEPMPRPVAVGRGVVVDATYWDHPLPRAVK